MQQLRSDRSKEQAADPSKTSGSHEDVLNVFVASYAIDRFCNSAPVPIGNLIRLANNRESGDARSR